MMWIDLQNPNQQYCSLGSCENVLTWGLGGESYVLEFWINELTSDKDRMVIDKDGKLLGRDGLDTMRVLCEYTTPTGK